jgi:hypothetical protein
LGVYPETSLAKARIRRAEARTLVADGIDPGKAKRETKLARIAAASETFEMVARTWLDKTSALRAATTQEKVTGWLEGDVFPVIGHALIADLKPTTVFQWMTTWDRPAASKLIASAIPASSCFPCSSVLAWCRNTRCGRHIRFGGGHGRDRHSS